MVDLTDSRFQRLPLCPCQYDPPTRGSSKSETICKLEASEQSSAAICSGTLAANKTCSRQHVHLSNQELQFARTAYVVAPNCDYNCEKVHKAHLSSLHQHNQFNNM